MEHNNHQTKEQTQHLLDYAYTYKDAYLLFKVSDMNLTVDIDAAYLVLPGAKSRYAGYFRLLNNTTTPGKTDNGAIHVECKTIRHVVSSAAEAETNGAFENALVKVNIQNLLHAMGHPPTPTIIEQTTPLQQDLLIKM